jgi:hypothetical protein
MLILTHNVVSLRAAPNADAEQVSQGIMGEVAEALAEEDEYVLLHTQDGYSGWALRRHTAPFDTDGASVPNTLRPLPEQRLISVPIAEAGELRTKLLFGTPVLPIGVDARSARVRVADGRETSLPFGCFAPACSERPLDSARLVSMARMFAGTPYLWGGGSSFGFDCSGFVQRLYAFFCVNLPRDAYLQVESPLGAQLEASETLRAGDLVFFAGDTDPLRRRVTHVGMAIDSGSFIHAQGKDGVVETSLSDPYYARIRCAGWRLAANP